METRIARITEETKKELKEAIKNATINIETPENRKKFVFILIDVSNKAVDEMLKCTDTNSIAHNYIIAETHCIFPLPKPLMKFQNETESLELLHQAETIIKSFSKQYDR